VLDGSIEVTVGDATHRLSEDDCLAMQLDAPISFRNRTRKPARYAVVLSTDRPSSIRR
jgi:mannose-6-phosphate isomerase-like protein (cupin superfamily)